MLTYRWWHDKLLLKSYGVKTQRRDLIIHMRCLNRALFLILTIVLDCFYEVMIDASILFVVY